MERLKLRAFGFALILFALPCCLPMPPGVPTVCGAILAIVCVQIVFGVRPIWLPSFIARRELATATLQKLLPTASAWVKRVERLTRPRLVFMTGPLGIRLVGVVVLILSIVVMLPIPFLGNMPPAAATLVIAIGLTERDGLIVLVGLLASAAALAISGAFALEAVRWLFGMVV